MNSWIESIKKYFPNMQESKSYSIDFEILNGIENSKAEVIMSTDKGVCLSWNNDESQYLLAVGESEPCSADELQDKLEAVLDTILEGDSSELYAARSLVIDDMHGLEVFGGNGSEENQELFYGLYLSDGKHGYTVIGFGNDDIEYVFDEISGAARTLYRKPKAATIHEAKAENENINAVRNLAKSLTPETDRMWLILNLTFDIVDGKFINQPSIIEISEEGVVELDSADLYSKDIDFAVLAAPLLETIPVYDITGFTLTLFADGRYGITYYPMGEEVYEDDEHSHGGCCGGHNHDHEEGGCCGGHGHSHEHGEGGCCGNHNHGEEGCNCHDNEAVYKVVNDEVMARIGNLIVPSFEKGWKKGMILVSFMEEYVSLSTYYTMGECYKEIISEDYNDDDMEDALMELQDSMYESDSNVDVFLFTFNNNGQDKVAEESLAYENLNFDIFVEQGESDSPLASNIAHIAEVFNPILSGTERLNYAAFQVGANYQSGNVFYVENPYVVTEEEIKALNNSELLFKAIEKDLIEIKDEFMRDYWEIIVYPNNKIGITFKEHPYMLTNEEQMNEVIEESGLENYKSLIHNLVRKEILARPYSMEVEDLMAVGVSKAGGFPDFPKGFTTPKTSDGVDMSFVAQINLSELKEFKGFDLPEKGMLYFFFDKESGEGKVLYSENTDNLSRYIEIGDGEIFDAASLFFENSISLPVMEDVKEFENLTEEQEESYFDLMSSAGKMKLFGYADILEDNMEKELGDDYVLLMQISSLMECSMNWGDDGYIYYWISKDDLKAKNFDNVKIIMQSYSY